MSYSVVQVKLPAGCTDYPGDFEGSEERFIPFQKLVFFKDGKYHIAIETKIWKYDHVLFYATFEPSKIDETSKTTVIMTGFEAVELSYGGPDEIEDGHRSISVQSEIDALLPHGFDTIVYCDRLKGRMEPLDTEWVHVETEDEYKPSRFFTYDLSNPLNKHTVLTLKVDTL